MFSKTSTTNYTANYSNEIEQLKNLISSAEVIIIGAGAGLSTSAGLHYGGKRFHRLFPDFIEKYGLTDMYSSAFYPYKTLEEHWAYFSRHIYYNRYESEINSCYADLLSLVEDKDYFVITTNADHLFLRSGFDKNRLFYTQGDYGLFQCSVPCHQETYENEDAIFEMVQKQKDFKIPTELIPKCPRCGKPMDVNLRKDGTFVEPKGWHNALERYDNFLNKATDKKVLFLELGIGYNTPSIVKYPFWQMTHRSKTANYVCINLDDASCPKEIKDKSICIESDISEVVSLCKKI